MTTLRMWNPGDLFQATRAMDRLFEEFLGGGGTAAPSEDSERVLPTYTLSVDILETKEAYVLTAPVAGFAPEAVEVTFDQGVLTIAAKAQPTHVQGSWIRQERPFGSWFRRLQLPDQVQGEAIKADVENGLLTVTVPKVPSPEPVRIPVGARSGKTALKG